MIPITRLVTIHPLLVHFTIGALPIIVIAYFLAFLYQSEHWTFAADVTLVIGALITVLTMTFGLISSAEVGWPGGLGFWRYLHMILGIASTAMLLLFAAYRLFARRSGHVVSGFATAAVATAIAVIVAATGWVGGEILVYDSGMAVTAAAQGAFAPLPAPATPRNLGNAMGLARADWAVANTKLARMLVRRPTDQDFNEVASRARDLEQVATWMKVNGAKTLPRPNAPKNSEPGEAGEPPMTRAEALTKMSGMLEDRAKAIQSAAERHDLKSLATAVGATSELCADCHEELRWRPHKEAAAPNPAPAD